MSTKTNPEFRVRVETDEPFDYAEYCAQHEYEHRNVLLTESRMVAWWLRHRVNIVCGAIFFAIVGAAVVELCR